MSDLFGSYLQFNSHAPSRFSFWKRYFLLFDTLTSMLYVFNIC